MKAKKSAVALGCACASLVWGVSGAAALDNPGTGDAGGYTFETIAPNVEVNVASGNLLVTNTDLAISAQNDGVAVSRYYNSESPATRTELGPRWTFGVGPDVHLTTNGSVITVTGPSGWQLPFSANSIGTYSSIAAPAYSLSQTSSGWTLSNQDGSSWLFDQNGNLVSTVDPNGTSFTIQTTSAGGNTYLGSYGLQSGQRANFSYNGDGTAREMDDPSSGHHYYSYNAYATGSLSQYSDGGGTSSYGYDGNGQLDSIDLPDGTHVTVSSSASGQVDSISSQPSGGGATSSETFDYSVPGQTTVSDSYGNTTTYVYDSNGLVTDAISGGPDSDAAQDFASQIETIGETNYSDTFSTATLQLDGTVDVYANAATDSDLQAAISQANTDSVPVDYINATKSYADLDTLASSLVSAGDQIVSDGVELVSGQPNPEAGTVDVTLTKPSSQDLSKLGSDAGVSAQYGTVTQSNYQQASAYYLNEHYGPGITVSSTYGSSSAVAATGSDNLHDVSPFFGGDFMKSSSGDCSGGFTFRGRFNTSNVFMTTAAHCGTGTWRNQQGGVIGNVTAQYVKNTPDYDDFETLQVTDARPYVWLTATRSVPINGWRIPGTFNPANPNSGKSKVTVIGTITGPHYGSEVLSTDAFSTVHPPDEHFNDGLPYFVAHMIRTVGGYCIPGSSGGPVVTRLPNTSTVQAIGTIVATQLDSDGNPLPDCLSQRIDYIQNEAHVDLITTRNP